MATQPTAVFLPEKPHEEKNLIGYRPLVAKSQTSLSEHTRILTKEKEIHKLTEGTCGSQWGGCGEGIVRESGMDMDTLVYLTWTTSKDLLDSTGNSAQYSIITLWFPGGRDGGRDKESLPSLEHVALGILVMIVKH